MAPCGTPGVHLRAEISDPSTARSHHSIVMSSGVEISLIISSLELEVPRLRLE